MLASPLLKSLWVSGMVLSAGIAPSPAAAAGNRPGPETVFLIHGMGRTPVSMLILAWRLRRAGYRVRLHGYVAAAEPLESITARLRERVEGRAGGGRYHLIGHSLGNVVIRDGFRRGYPTGLGRVVMLAPPNRPSELAGRLRGRRLFQGATGDSGQKLADPAFYAGLPVPSAEFGVLAGCRGHRFFGGRPNDGILAVEETRLDGMRDFAIVPHTHTFMMNGRDTFERCMRFLREGRF